MAGRGKVKSEDVLKRESIMKNFVMRRLIEIRIQKKKPKLSDVMKLMKQRDLSNPKVRDDFKRRFLALYEDSVPKHEKIEDPKYDKLK